MPPIHLLFRLLDGLHTLVQLAHFLGDGDRCLRPNVGTGQIFWRECSVGTSTRLLSNPINIYIYLKTRCIYVPRSNTPMLQASSEAVPLCILCKWLERPPVVIIKVSHSNNLQGRPWQLQPWRGCCRSQSCFSRSWRSTRNARPRDSEHRKHISSNTIQDTSWSINGSNILASGKFEVVKSNST